MEVDELKLKEYEKLQNEIYLHLDQISSIEKYSITLSGGIFTWLIINYKAFELPEEAFFIPLVIVVLFGFLAQGLYRRINLIGRYIKTRYEDLLMTDTSSNLKFGWETYLEQSLKGNNSLLISSRYVMWIFHVLINLTIAILAMNGVLLK